VSGAILKRSTPVKAKATRGMRRKHRREAGVIDLLAETAAPQNIIAKRKPKKLAKANRKPKK